jgi:hypothetical protein
MSAADREEGVSMDTYGEGTLLTCVHEDCPCRIRVEVACTCPDASEPYRCTCGAEMIAVEE